jgi:LAS superfamily LD-carboxypeptidase LdcB
MFLLFTYILQYIIVKVNTTIERLEKIYNELMKSLNHEQKLIFWGFGIVAVMLIAGGVYSYVSYKRMDSLSSRIDALSANVSSLTTIFASTTVALQSSIDQTHSSLSSALSVQQQNVGTIQQQLGGFQNQVGNLSGTVNNIQKLSQIDPELLEKYSKVFFLNENYVPAHLSEIPLTYQYSDSKQLLFVTQALPRLESMIDTASSTGVKLYVDSAYRSFDEQKALKGDYTMTFGAGTANSFSADQGYSEHQLGTAVDMITIGLGGQLDGFDTKPAYSWMLQNAYKYGFILSYPKNNGYYVYEPWHWRFVGIKLATDLHNEGKNFYDLDQRTIDTYLVNIFD